MRITGGFARGIFLDTPKSDITRPATDSARQAIFSSLGEIVVGSEVLDIFAGTGAYGLEAISRGAKSCFFVEKNKTPYLCLKKNYQKLANCLKDSEYIHSANFSLSDVFKFRLKDKSFDLIFADPPYAFFKDSYFMKNLFNTFKLYSNENTLIIMEAPAEYTFDNADFEIVKRLGKSSKGKPSQIILKCI